MDSVGQLNYTTAVPGEMIASIASTFMIVSLAVNLLILITTFTKYTILKQPAIIFLTSFIVANILFNVAYMPSLIGSSIADDWIYSETENEGVEDGTCQFAGFVLYTYQYSTSFTVALISIDRFLFIVKPLFYKEYMKTWVAIVMLVVVWVIAILLYIPFHSFRVYEYNSVIRTCVLSLQSNRILIGIGITTILCTVVVVIVTSIWTFCFVRKYLERNQHTYESESVYTRKKNRVMGIFGSLVAVTAICYVPVFLIGILGASGLVGFERVPELAYLGVSSAVLNTTLNPIVQLYFRKELTNSIVGKLKKCSCCKRRSNAIVPVQSLPGQKQATMPNVANTAV